jgi:glycosyltransferase involved in cell wall biosynthesis
MRLAVLVSERCGNHYEAVAEGENGYLLDPSNPASVRKAFETMMSRVSDWKRMGEASGQLYCATFDRDKVIERFLNGLRDFSGD